MTRALKHNRVVLWHGFLLSNYNAWCNYIERVNLQSLFVIKHKMFITFVNACLSLTKKRKQPRRYLTQSSYLYVRIKFASLNLLFATTCHFIKVISANVHKTRSTEKLLLITLLSFFVINDTWSLNLHQHALLANSASSSSLIISIRYLVPHPRRRSLGLSFSLGAHSWCFFALHHLIRRKVESVLLIRNNVKSEVQLFC